jgi:PTH2 family peptidyl-tRNA hydrolase
MSEIKQVIIIRKDLKMRRGKEIVQGAHASMAWLSHCVRHALETGDLEITPAQVEWISGLFAKITLQVSSEEELLAVADAAKQAGIECHVITDAGRTEFNGVATITACAIGPDESEKINAITGKLALY